MKSWRGALNRNVFEVEISQSIRHFINLSLISIRKIITVMFSLHVELNLSSFEVTRNININLINLKQDLAQKELFYHE